MKLSVLILGASSLCVKLAFATPAESMLQPRGESSPNPVAAMYPDQITGTINSTLSVVPIPYELARSIIPSQYKILTKAYQSLLPGFPKDKYPLVVRSALDHGVGVYAFNYSLPDFQSIHISYPFVDLLGDGHSSFNYNKYLLISANNTIAVGGATTDGTIVPPSTFDPDLEAYAFVPPSAATPREEIYLNAYTTLSTTGPAVATKFKVLKKVGPWPVSFYENVTNQIIFSDGITCNQQITLFNTSLSIGKNAPVGIHGNIKIIPPYFPEECGGFDDVYGIKVDIAFVETPGIVCETLKV